MGSNGRSRATTWMTSAALAAVLGATAAQAGELRGVITDAEGDVRLEGATVVLEELGRTTTAGRDGGFRFGDVPGGDYTLTISIVGGAPQTLSVSVPDDGIENVDVALGAEAGVADRVTVVGQRGSLFSALNKKKASEGLIEVLSADAIGQFPDQNVSEAVRRVTGVSVENDQGEGRFVVIRGVDPSLNATNVNGFRIPAPEGDTRGVALDVIDSEILESIIIEKTRTADKDGDAIGGTIDIETTTAFDRDGFFFKGSVGGVASEYESDLTPKISAAISDIFMDGKLGLAGSISFRERTFQTENQEVDGGWNDERLGGLLVHEELEFRDYVVTRERFNVSFNADYRPNENHDLYFRSLFSEFSDQEFRSRLEAKYGDVDDTFAGSDQLNGIAFFNASGDELEFDRDIKDRLEEQTIVNVAGGGQSRVDAFIFDYALSYSYADETEPNRLDTAFRLNTEDDVLFAQDTSNPLRPFTFGDFDGALDINDASAFEIDEWEFLNGETTDEELAASLDVTREGFTDTGTRLVAKGGVKLRQREKDRDVEIELYEGGDVTLADFATEVEYRFGDLGPVPDPGAVRSFFFSNVGSLDFQDDDSAVASAIEDYQVEEDITAVYGLFAAQNDAFSLNIGLRIEETEFEALGFGFEENEDAGVEEVRSITVSRDYTNVLPSVSGKWNITDDLILKGGYFAAVSRPNFGAIVPAFEIEDDEVSAGNPFLVAQTADNLDLTAEYYIGNNGLITVGAFMKTFDDYIADAAAGEALGGQLASFYGAQVASFSEVETSVNLDDGELLGFEASYSQALDMLPGLLDGLIVGVNATLVDGDATLDDGRNIPLPKLSENLANFTLGYEKGPLDVKAVLGYRSEYLDVINEGGNGIDRFVDDHTQLDLSARFAFTDQVRGFVELNNVTNEPFRAFFNTPNGKALSQYEEYGYSYSFGLKYKY